MKSIFLIFLAFVLIGSISQTACTYDHIEVTFVCDTAQVATFSAVVQPILANSCTSCHSGSNPQGGVDLSSWAATQDFVTNGSLVGSISYESGYSKMPKNAAQLSTCEIEQVRKWVLAGAKND
jgi:mono/diheme cytochrome c family protein